VATVIEKFANSRWPKTERSTEYSNDPKIRERFVLF